MTDDELAAIRQRVDFEFIAHARTDIPALLDALDAVTRERDQVDAIHAALSEETRAAWAEVTRLRAALERI